MALDWATNTLPRSRERGLLMKRLVEVYRIEGKWPWVESCDRCLKETRHTTFDQAITSAHRHVWMHYRAGFRSE